MIGHGANESVCSHSVSSAERTRFICASAVIFARILVSRDPAIFSNPLYHGGRIATNAAAAVWDSEQTTALVIPYRFNAYVGSPSQASNRNGHTRSQRSAGGRATRGYFGHDLTPYLGTEPRLQAVSKYSH